MTVAFGSVIFDAVAFPTVEFELSSVAFPKVELELSCREQRRRLVNLVNTLTSTSYQFQLSLPSTWSIMLQEHMLL